MSDTLVVEPGSEKDANSVLLGTLRTRHIRNERRPEWKPADLREGVAICKKSFPDLITRSVTAIYNCVGMVFATRRTWVDTSLVYKLLADDGYERLTSIDDAQVGDVAVYKTSTGTVMHVGVFIEKNADVQRARFSFRILSKWGPWAEFIHRPDEVFPAWGTLSEVWTDRK
jgi:hypothetical protein